MQKRVRALERWEKTNIRRSIHFFPFFPPARGETKRGNTIKPYVLEVFGLRRCENLANLYNGSFEAFDIPS